ncbi:MAG: tRNA (guanosine(46)-N7)-methyltransferase TrmB [Bacilli bacterium]
MRLKKVKGAQETILSSQVVIKTPQQYKGKFQQIFNNNNPIYLEIGMGKGDFIVKNAIKYPNINFIGIEKYDSVIVRAIDKAQNIPNLRLIKIDALLIDEIFDHEISTIYLNFSDPWPKNRHEHRRLTSFPFLKKYDKIFKQNKIIIQKTDNRKFFEYSLMSYVNYNYKIEELSLNLYQDDLKDNIASEYEQKFIAQQLNIYKIIVTKDD